VGDNIIGDATGCGFAPGTGDQVGVSAGALHLGPLDSNGGPTQTMALLSGSVAIGHGDTGSCTASPINNLDQRGFSRNATSRNACDVGAYDTNALTIAKGWNLIGVPLQSAGTSTASGLLSSLNGQVGTTAISALATYANGRFRLYVPSYTAGQNLSASQGIFVLSSKAGSWTPPGTAYASGQMVSLQRGWNLAASPSPYGGLNGDGIKSEIGASGAGGCGLQEIATYSGGAYHVYTPSGGPTGAGFHVPVTAGMWIECANAYQWNPS
jgi:hypothetical protein